MICQRFKTSIKQNCKHVRQFYVMTMKNRSRAIFIEYARHFFTITCRLQIPQLSHFFLTLNFGNRPKFGQIRYFPIFSPLKMKLHGINRFASRTGFRNQVSVAPVKMSRITNFSQKIKLLVDSTNRLTNSKRVEIVQIKQLSYAHHQGKQRC